MVLVDPEPVELGLGLGVVGGEVTGEVDGGGDDGITGGLEGRVSGGDEKLPCSKKNGERECRVIKIHFFFFSNGVACSKSWVLNSCHNNSGDNDFMTTFICV